MYLLWLHQSQTPPQGFLINRICAGSLIGLARVIPSVAETSRCPTLHLIGLSLLFSCSFTLLYSCSFVYVLFPMLHAPSSFNFFSHTSFLFPPSLAPSPFTGCVLCTYFNPLHLITPPSLAGSPFTCEILPPSFAPYPWITSSPFSLFPILYSCSPLFSSLISSQLPNTYCMLYPLPTVAPAKLLVIKEVDGNCYRPWGHPLYSPSHRQVLYPCLLIITHPFLPVVSMSWWTTPPGRLLGEFQERRSSCSCSISKMIFYWDYFYHVCLVSLP